MTDTATSDPVIARLNTALEGRYRIDRELGQGGMATVYLAHDIRHGRHVALKVLKPELAAVVGAERFLTEIKTTANLQHPHILPLFDSGEADSFLYYVMPYVEGESLRERLEREHQLPVEDAVGLAEKIADALDYAHDRGVVHRDVKPANVLLSERGEPLVADFGIALAISQAGGGRITETGLSLGTPHYMSPEQASGDRSVDRRSDIYALGCVLYEMLAGEPPYGGGTAQSVLAKILTEEARRVTRVRRTVPRHVDAAVARALEKLPADRFDTAGAFRKALADEEFRHEAAGAAMTTGAGDPARPTTHSRRAPLLAALVAATLALAAFLAGRATVSESPEPVTRFPVMMPDGVSPISVCCGPIQALSPDGETLVFLGTVGGRRVLYRRRLGQLEIEEIPGTEGASVPFFSPDGRWVGFHADERLRKVPLAGGPPVPIADVDRVDGASWGDNDVIVFAVWEDSLYTVPGAGGVPAAVAAADGGDYVHPWMLPGGEAALARIDGPGSASDARIVAVDLESGRADTLGFGTRVAYASGHLVISGADGTLLVQPFDPRQRRTTGQAVAILDGVATAGPSIGEFALSASGDLAYKVGGAGGLESLILRGPGGPEAIPLPEPDNYEDPTFSPDGRRIAVRIGSSGQDGQIWIWDRDQRTQQLLTVEGERNFSPVWSPDGSRIAFAGVRDGAPPQLYWQPADGSGAAEQLLETEHDAWPSHFSPDGRSLVFTTQSDDGGLDVGLLDLADHTVRWLAATPAAERHGQVSPDGRWLAYTSDHSGQAEVYVRALDGSGGRTQVSAGGGNSPRWAPDGGVLYYATTEGSPVTAAQVRGEGGFRVLGRTEAFDGVDDLNRSTTTWDVGPDGEEVVYIGRGGGNDQGYVWILNWPGIVRAMRAGDRP